LDWQTCPIENSTTTFNAWHRIAILDASVGLWYGKQALKFYFHSIGGFSSFQSIESLHMIDFPLN